VRTGKPRARSANRKSRTFHVTTGAAAFMAQSMTWSSPGSGLSGRQEK